MSFVKTLRVEFRRMFTGLGFWGAITVFMLYNVRWFNGVLQQYAGKDRMDIPSADMMFSLNLVVAGYAIVGIAALLCALPASGNYITDERSGILSVLFTKTKPAYYYSAKLITAFCGTFIAMAVPLLINQLLCLSFFDVLSPMKDLSNSPTAGSTYMLETLDYVPFPLLRDMHPYLNNLLYTALFSAFLGLLSAAATGATFLIRRFRLISFAIPYLLYMGAIFVDGNLNVADQVGADKTYVAFTDFLVVDSYGLRVTPLVFGLEVALFILLACGAAIYATRRETIR